MIFITETTTRDELLTAIYANLDIVQHFIDCNLDPENMELSAIRETVTAWIEAGNECA